MTTTEGASSEPTRQWTRRPPEISLEGNLVEPPPLGGFPRLKAPPSLLNDRRARNEPASGASTIVAIPAFDEEARILACIAALSVQRDGAGSPLRPGTFDVLVLANNCSDRTVPLVRGAIDRVPFALDLVEARLPPHRANAGWARKTAMDEAATRLSTRGARHGIILTTDADSRVAPTWVHANLTAFAGGVDCVAGYIDADPDEFLALGPGFGERGRAEDRYLGLVAEIDALCDPRPHDPWPNHRVASGASLGVTLAAYRAIGGLTPLPLGEDVALVRALDRAGFAIRHSFDASVITSCRFDGRARGGAADTMRSRHENLDADCDVGIEVAARVLRRAAWRGRLRRMHATGTLEPARTWAGALGLGRRDARQMVRDADGSFAGAWERIEAASPALRRRGEPLRPSDLAGETRRAERILRLLRGAPLPFRSTRRADTPIAERRGEPAIA